MNDINGKTKIMGLIGHNISHTLSPFIHNYSKSKLKINIVYLPIDVPALKIKSTLDTLINLGAVGFNVTVPHKLAVGKIITGAEKSVNTIYFENNNLMAASTDGIGFCNGLTQMNRNINSFDHLIIIGNGGATSGLLDYFEDSAISFEKIDLFRRDSSKDKRFEYSNARSFRFHEMKAELFKKALMESSSKTLLIQATSAPLLGNDLSYLCDDLTLLKGCFVDLVYGTPSKIYSECQKIRIPAIDGLPMLIEQARASQNLWWNQSLEYQEIERALKEYNLKSTS